MLRETTIIVEIDEHGNSSVDLTGFHGKGCGDVAKILRGSDCVRASRAKPEFHVPVEAREIKGTVQRPGTTRA